MTHTAYTDQKNSHLHQVSVELSRDIFLRILKRENLLPDKNMHN